VTPYFEVICRPTRAHIDIIEQLNPHSPFNTAAYAAACSEMRVMPYVFALKARSTTVSGCLGFLQRGRISRRLEIVSAPRISEPDIFWDGVFDFCRKQRVWDLDIETYASDVTGIPSLPGEVSRRKRCEFVLDLERPELAAGFSGSHRRNIKRAQKAGLFIRRTRDQKACHEHLSLIKASMDRRKARGEDTEMPETTHFFKAMLKTGAAELFQAADGERVVSSMMVVRSTYSAYDQTSGNSPDGLRMGASTYLISEVAAILKKEGVRLFNLGGAGDHEPGLQEFKTGFGIRRMFSEAASFSLASPFRLKLRAAARLMRKTPCDLFAALEAKHS
jgi:hypothetical protein